MIFFCFFEFSLGYFLLFTGSEQIVVLSAKASNLHTPEQMLFLSPPPLQLFHVQIVPHRVTSIAALVRICAMWARGIVIRTQTVKDH